MINNFDRSHIYSLTEMLLYMDILQLEFILTGSRAGLGIITKESDWDFFIEYSNELDIFLADNYFRQIHDASDANYNDNNVQGVFRRRFPCGTNIDIQVVTNKNERMKQMLRVKNHYLPILLALPKIKRHFVWNLARKDITSDK